MWAREIASSGTGMAPGLCGMVGGRPKATPCLRLHSFLYPKDQVETTGTRKTCLLTLGFIGFLNSRIRSYLMFLFCLSSCQIPATVRVGDQPPLTYICPSFPSSPASDDSADKKTQKCGSGHKGEETFTLEELAFARSGDKGNTKIRRIT